MRRRRYIRSFKLKDEDTQSFDKQRVIAICNYYGIRKNTPSKDELTALGYVLRNKNIPYELESRLLQTKDSRLQSIKSS